MGLGISFLILFVLALAATQSGFRRLVHFISVGYAAAITLMALAAAVMFWSGLDLWAALHLALLFGWGLRLWVFLRRREAAPGYQKELAEMDVQYGGIKTPARLGIWVGVSALYVLMFLPGLLDAAASRQLAGTMVWLRAAGMLISAGGIVLETAADRQKSRYKTAHPRSFCSAGLYRWVRCPNYLGEILFWVGSWVMGIPFYSNLLAWAASLFGLVCIVLIMMGSTKRLERAQGERYGHLPEYQNYVRSVPVLFPWTHIYTLQGVKVYLE